MLDITIQKICDLWPLQEHRYITHTSRSSARVMATRETHVGVNNAWKPSISNTYFTLSLLKKISHLSPVHPLMINFVHRSTRTHIDTNRLLSESDVLATQSPVRKMRSPNNYRRQLSSDHRLSQLPPTRLIPKGLEQAPTSHGLMKHDDRASYNTRQYNAWSDYEKLHGTYSNPEWSLISKNGNTTMWREALKHGCKRELSNKINIHTVMMSDNSLKTIITKYRRKV